MSSCTTGAPVAAIEPPAEVKALATRHQQYALRYVGSNRRKANLISVEGWVYQESGNGEFMLFDAKPALDAKQIGRCLSGRFESRAANERLFKSVGKKVRIVGTYAPTGIDDGSGSMSAVHNFCMGDIEIHAIRFEVLN